MWSLAVVAMVASVTKLEQYMNIQAANISSSLDILKNLPLKYFDANFGSNPSRRQLGLIGPDIKEIIPTSVTVVPKKTFPNPDDHSNPLIVDNYHVVDLSQVFMHNVAATQQLLFMQSEIKDLLAAIEDREADQNELLANLTKYLQQEASVQLIEKRRTAEAYAEKVKLEITLAAVKADEDRKTNDLKFESEKVVGY
jgi:hypothetical protein